MSEPIRALILTTAPDQARRLVRQMRRNGYELLCRRVEPFDAAPAALEGAEWDILLADEAMPGFDLARLATWSGNRNPPVRLVILADAFVPESAAAAVRAGADDYLGRDELDRLAVTLPRQLRAAQRCRQCAQGTREMRRAPPSAVPEVEESYRQLIDLCPDAIFIHCDGQVVFANPATLAMFGATSAEQLVGRPVLDLVHSDDRAMVAERMRLGLDTGEVLPPMEKRCVRVDGTVFDVEVSAIPFRHMGRAARLVFLRDVTQRKRVAQALQESEARYKSLFEDSPISLWEEDFSGIKAYLEELRGNGVTDFDAFLREHPEAVAHCMRLVRVLGVNRTTLRMYEAGSKAELLGGLERIMDEEAFDALRAGIVAIAEGKTWHEIETVNRTLTGKRLHIALTWTVVPGQEKTYSRMPVSIIDITARTQAEQALRASEERFRAIFDHAPIGVNLVDADGHVLLSNPAMHRMLGYTEQELRGLRVCDFSHPEDQRLDERKNRELQAGRCREYQMEKRYIRKDGSIVWGQLNVSLLGQAGDGQQMCVGLVEDITQRKRMEEAVREQTNLRQLSHQIIRSQEEERRRISRELHDEAGQALTAIKLNTELLAKRLPAELAHLQRLARDTAELSANLITEMRRIAAALRPAMLETLGLLPTLRWYVKSVEMRYELPVELVSHGLKGRLEPSLETTIYRIVQEALTNVVRHAQAKHAAVRVACGPDALELTISDDGRGMTPGAGDRGTGLIGIRERASLFGGSVTIESRPRVGTALRVRFPVTPEATSCPAT